MSTSIPGLSAVKLPCNLGFPNSAALSMKDIGAAESGTFQRISAHFPSHSAYAQMMVRGAVAYEFCMGNACLSGVEEAHAYVLRRAHTSHTIKPIIAGFEFVRPIVNPHHKPVKVYYPAMGLDLVSVLAATEASCVIGSDLYRCFCESPGADIFASMAFSIIRMVGENNLHDVTVPPEGSCGRAEFNFRMPNSEGTWVDRQLIYYTGVDAAQFVPPELESGYNVRYDSCPAWFYVWPSTQRLSELMVEGGIVTFTHQTVRKSLLEPYGRGDAMPEDSDIKTLFQHKDRRGDFPAAAYFDWIERTYQNKTIIFARKRAGLGSL